MAVKLYRKAADQDYVEAIRILAVIYRYDEIPIGAPIGNCQNMGLKNLSEAAKWYSKGAELGDVDSQMEFGDLFLTGDGVTKDQIEAYKW